MVRQQRKPLRKRKATPASRKTKTKARVKPKPTRIVCRRAKGDWGLAGGYVIASLGPRRNCPLVVFDEVRLEADIDAALARGDLARLATLIRRQRLMQYVRRRVSVFSVNDVAQNGRCRIDDICHGDKEVVGMAERNLQGSRMLFLVVRPRTRNPSLETQTEYDAFPYVLLGMCIAWPTVEATLYLAVLCAWQKQHPAKSRISGLGAAVLDAVERYAASRGFRQLTLHTVAAAEQFYADHGYEHAGAPCPGAAQASETSTDASADASFMTKCLD
jgi:GNAT superfamily N-acetyltransferase